MKRESSEQGLFFFVKITGSLLKNLAIVPFIKEVTNYVEADND